MSRLKPTRAALGIVVVALLAGCSSTPSTAPSPAESSPGATITDMGPMLTVTSTDFVDGGELDPQHSANAWGQCSGANLNPQLSWEGAPEGTVTYAITMRDISAGNWSHWVHVNIPADVTSVATGASESLPGTAGQNAAPTVGYFGPCPPGPNHRYEFTVWALDAELDVDAEPTYPNFWTASQDHVLATGTIIGLYSSP